MPARADWHAPAIDVPADPFQRVEDVGVRVPLDDDPDGLFARLVELVGEEARLDALGVTCSVKVRVDTSCSACPLAGRDALCAVGLEQERLVTRLAVLKDGLRRH